MTHGPAAGRRLGAAALALGLGLLIAEGLLSLLGDRSLKELVVDQSVVRRWQAPTEEARWQAAARNPGPWQVHEDPLVGFTARANAELEIFGGSVSTDELGLRRRPGPPAPEDALHVVVLGDSVAFGWGVDDDQTLAHRLEVHLTSVLGDDAPPVACRTVAVPGWNHRNAVQFLLDHRDKIPADIVIYMPIPNDLANTYGILETGHRRAAPDVATPDPRLVVSTDRTQYGLLELSRRLEEQGLLDEQAHDMVGPPVLTADLSPESSRRFDENAASIRELARSLEAAGGRLLLLQYQVDRYFWSLLARLEPGDADLLRLLPTVPPEFTLPANPHPSAETLDVFALWCARALLERGWIPGAPGPEALPDPPPRYEELRAQVLEPVDWRAGAARSRADDRALLGPTVDVQGGQGLLQVYGGLHADGTAERHLLLLLQPPADVPLELVLRVASLEGRSDLLPLRVQVEVDGNGIGSLVLDAPGPATGRWPLPEAGPSPEPMEVRLLAARDVATLHQDRRRMASYQLLDAHVAAR